MIEVVLPVGFVVEEGIVEVGGVFIKEGDAGAAADVLVVGQRTEKLCKVAAVLASIHDFHLVGCLLVAGISAEIDAGGHALTATGVDEQDAVTALGTVERRTVLDDAYFLYVIGVDDVEDIVDEAIVERGAVVLHIDEHAIDDYEGLRIRVKGVEAIDEERCTLCRHTATADGAHATSKVLLHFVLNGQGIGGLNQQGLVVVERGAIVIEIITHASHKVGLGDDVIFDSYLEGIVTFGCNVEHIAELGHLDGIGSVVLSNGRIITVVECTNLDTACGQLGGSIVDVALNFLQLILWCSLSLGRSGLLGLGFVIATLGSLCGKHTRTRKHEKADTGAESPLHHEISSIDFHFSQCLSEQKTTREQAPI